MTTPLLLTFLYSENKVKVYSVAAVSDETFWVTGPTPVGAVIFILVPLKWSMNLSVRFTRFHCRVMLDSSCAAGLNPSA